MYSVRNKLTAKESKKKKRRKQSLRRVVASQAERKSNWEQTPEKRTGGDKNTTTTTQPVEKKRFNFQRVAHVPMEPYLLKQNTSNQSLVLCEREKKKRLNKEEYQIRKMISVKNWISISVSLFSFFVTFPYEHAHCWKCRKATESDIKKEISKKRNNRKKHRLYREKGTGN